LRLGCPILLFYEMARRMNFFHSLAISQYLILSSVLVSSGKYHALCRRFASHHADTRSFVAFERNAADGCLGIGFDLLFCFGSTVPMAEQEASFFDLDLEFVVAVHFAGHGGAIVECFGIDVFLNDI